MLTTSEIAVTATIWVLTAAGGFFTARSVVRKKRLALRLDSNRTTEHPPTQEKHISTTIPK